ncbi:BPSL0761 family protein [Pseudomonas sp. CR3202]|uniref:BPSL0761 family protein n=1 Tax=Pseudomonas sp. CR3202 TaxID=3351532 RepID=UPI003BF148F0
MNLPDERTKSIYQMWSHLVELAHDPDLPKDVREDANWLLRHYPYSLSYKVDPYLPVSPYSRDGGTAEQ